MILRQVSPTASESIAPPESGASAETCVVVSKPAASSSLAIASRMPSSFSATSTLRQDPIRPSLPHDLPPIRIVVGSTEVLLDDPITIAESHRAAGATPCRR
jgi:acetyl esterase/lipase